MAAIVVVVVCVVLVEVAIPPPQPPWGFGSGDGAIRSGARTSGISPTRDRIPVNRASAVA